jgi:glutathione S-transferase
MALKLYYDAMSQPSRALLLFIRANSIPCEEIAVALRKGEHKKEEFKQINPFQKVPVIEHNGFKLTESVSILRYLSREFPVKDHWYPKDTKLRAKVDEYMAWQHLNLRMFGSMVFQHKIIIPLAKGQPPNERSVKTFEKGLEGVLEQIEKVWLRENPYIAGKELSIADLLAVTELEQPGMADFDVRKDRPKIVKYMERVRNDLQPHYDQVHSVVRDVTRKYKEATMQSKL